MTNKELKYLEDMRLAIEDITSFIGDNKKFDVFNRNKMMRNAVERSFQIIGEAIKNFKTLNQDVEIQHAKEIIGLRNKIVHAYDSINYEHLWAIIANHLPNLRREIEKLIKDNESKT